LFEYDGLMVGRMIYYLIWFEGFAIWLEWFEWVRPMLWLDDNGG